MLIDCEVLQVLAARYGCTPAEVNALLQQAAADLKSSVPPDGLPEMAIRLASVRLMSDRAPR